MSANPKRSLANHFAHRSGAGNCGAHSFLNFRYSFFYFLNSPIDLTTQYIHATRKLSLSLDLRPLTRILPHNRSRCEEFFTLVSKVRHISPAYTRVRKRISLQTTLRHLFALISDVPKQLQIKPYPSVKSNGSVCTLSFKISDLWCQ